MKSKLFSGIKQFWQLNIYKRHFLSQEETEANADFRFSILIFGELAPIPRCPHDYRISLLPYAGKGKGSRHRCVCVILTFTIYLE